MDKFMVHERKKKKKNKNNNNNNNKKRSKNNKSPKLCLEDLIIIIIIIIIIIRNGAKTISLPNVWETYNNFTDIKHVSVHLVQDLMSDFLKIRY